MCKDMFHDKKLTATFDLVSFEIKVPYTPYSVPINKYQYPALKADLCMGNPITS